MTGKPVKVGLAGCGNISGQYLENAKAFEAFDIVACADMVAERAQEQAKKYGVSKAYGLEEVLADPEVEIVLNLTPPKAHAEVALAAIAAGKHIYTEKPLGVTREEGARVLAAAKAKGVLVGGAPDTFLGASNQTCRKAIDDGAIGQPLAAASFFLGRGMEMWHPDPEFFYKPGAGPMLDLGPYSLTTLVSLLGPVRRVSGTATIGLPERLVTSEPKRGTRIKVEVPTTVIGVLDFANGAAGTVITSFDVWSQGYPFLEIYGTEGTLRIPDGTSMYSGPVQLLKGGADTWEELPLVNGYTDYNRGIGVADMAMAIRTGRPHRASGELTYHVLDIMQAFHDASEQGKHIILGSTCTQPKALPTDLPFGKLD